MPSKMLQHSSSETNPFRELFRMGCFVFLLLLAVGHWWVHRPANWCASDEQSVSFPPSATIKGQTVESAELVHRTERLLALMGRRLGLMHDVARWKWNAGTAIGDPKRERLILDQMADNAHQRGLSPGFARSFLQAQIDASKQLQRANFARWRAESRSKFQGVPDLNAELRPLITSLSDELITLLVEIGSERESDEFGRLVRTNGSRYMAGEGITIEIRSLAVAPLLSAGRRGKRKSVADAPLR